jgi:Zn-dependent protease with chaperone function
MTTTDPASDRLKQLTSDLKRILEKRLALFLLEAGERLGGLSGKAVSVALVLLLVTFGLLFVLISMALFLGSVLRNPAGGYALVGVFLFVGAFFTWLLMPGMIERRVRDKVVEALLAPEPPMSPESEPTTIPSDDNDPARSANP